MIAGTAVPRRRERVLTQGADEELVLLHVDRGTYFSLNEVGARVWELCDGNHSVNDVVEVLTAEYEAPAAAIEEDVCALIGEFMSDDLVTV